MKSYSYLILIVIIAFLLSLNTVKIFALEEISFFITVIGLIYGLISAFTINNAWERFSKIRDEISNETQSLEFIYIFSKVLPDKASIKKLKAKIIEYCEEVPTIEWHNYWKSEKTHKKFRDIKRLISNIKVRKEKDILLLDKIIDALRDAANARNEQLVLAQTRISKIQWVLNIFLSGILVIALIFLQITNYALSTYVIMTMIIAVLMILFVIYELDTMKVAEEEVSIEPYKKLAHLLKTEI